MEEIELRYSAYTPRINFSNLAVIIKADLWISQEIHCCGPLTPVQQSIPKKILNASEIISAVRNYQKKNYFKMSIVKRVCTILLSCAANNCYLICCTMG